MPAPKTSVVPVPGEGTIVRLDALAAEMTARGWAAYVTTPSGRPPRLFVQHPRQSTVGDTVLAAVGDATGEWGYWFGHAERITPCDCPAKAAEAVVRALTPEVDSAAEPAAPATQRLAKGPQR
jgi:hypothetical protein